jgi:hypothetical protein
MEEAHTMRQVQHPSARARKPNPTAGPAHPAVRPAVQRWLERMNPPVDPLAAPDRPYPPRREMTPMSTLRRLAARLLLIAAPAALLLLETAGSRIPP